MQQYKIPSTSSAISPQQERTEPSGHRPCRHGVKSSLRREPDVPGDLLRAIFGNVTKPSKALTRTGKDDLVVRPAKAGMFSKSQTCRGKNQEPRSLDSRVAGNQDPEAYRQDLLWGDYESPGRNKSERGSGLEKSKIRGPSLQPEGEGSMGSRNLIDAATSPRRGGMRQHGDKDMPSNWRSPPRPDEKNVGAR